MNHICIYSRVYSMWDIYARATGKTSMHPRAISYSNFPHQGHLTVKRANDRLIITSPDLGDAYSNKVAHTASIMNFKQQLA